MKYLDLLGYRVSDCVTGFKGVVETVAYDLYGCIQAIVRPPAEENGKTQDARWFDAKRLSKISVAPVMPVPAFEMEPVSEKGPAEKPARA